MADYRAPLLAATYETAAPFLPPRECLPKPGPESHTSSDNPPSSSGSSTPAYEKGSGRQPFKSCGLFIRSPSLASLSGALRNDRASGLLTAATLALIAGVAATGTFLGPRDPDLTGTPWQLASSAIGWTYFACWSLSFWPQIYHNFKRQAVWGFSFDFGIYNLVGFGAYAIFNCAMYFSPAIREAYAATHDGASSPVQMNDVVFSLHALAATLLTLFQCIIYDRAGQRVSETCKLLVSLALLAATGYAMLVAVGSHLCTCFTLLSWLYLLSSVKLLVTLFKYIPQIALHFQQKHTGGWSIGNCLLDLAGGVLSLVQVLGDAHMKGGANPIQTAPVKFGLGFVSIVADIIIMFQHYVLYPDGAPAVPPHIKRVSSGGSSSGAPPGYTPLPLAPPIQAHLHVVVSKA